MLRLLAGLGLAGWLSSGCFLFTDLDPAVAPADAADGAPADTDIETGGGASIGEFCAENEDCAQGNCQNEVCCGPGRSCCSHDHQCADLIACNLSLSECFHDCHPEGTGEDDTACHPDAHCEPSGCVADLESGSCDEPSDCASGSCEASICQ